MAEEASLIEKEKVLMNQVDVDQQAAEKAEPTLAQHTGGASTNVVQVEEGFVGGAEGETAATVDSAAAKPAAKAAKTSDPAA